MTNAGEDLQLFDTDPYRDAALMLRDRFMVPPFTILDTTSHHWQRRKRNWLSLGIESELGRDVVTFGGTGAGTDEVTGKIRDFGTTSVFDPVLCELVYRWWAPADGMVLDPFAGGSVRGIVASMMGRSYYGIELRAEQVDANRVQSERLGDLYPGDPPGWSVGDSDVKLGDVKHDHVDMVFTCPPYGDLEVYSTEPGDLSNMTAHGFEEAYFRIIEKSVACLRSDRFAVFVVGNYRDKSTSMLRDLSGLTIAAFQAAGCDYYAEVVLGTAISSAAIRASASFAKGRKPIRTHQTILVFVKGDWRAANAACEPFRESGDGLRAARGES